MPVPPVMAQSEGLEAGRQTCLFLPSISRISILGLITGTFAVQPTVRDDSAKDEAAWSDLRPLANRRRLESVEFGPELMLC